MLNPSSRVSVARRLAKRISLAILLSWASVSCVGTSDVPRWGLFETAFVATDTIDNPFQAQELFVIFTSPSRQSHTVRGFWDGGSVWRVRFSPGEEGRWTFSTRAVPDTDEGLHGRTGSFRVTSASGDTRFDKHGPVRVSASRTYLEHADGTPFFWMADTGWNAALMSTPEEWRFYVSERARQGFNAIMWVATQWRGAPNGDRLKERAYTGADRIELNTAFFQRLDARVAELDRAGMLNVPVLLWAIGEAVDPGASLPEDQAARLARYMIARWQGYNSVWILAGDGNYRGERADRWKRIGRAVFDTDSHAPAVMHPGGMHWVFQEFLNEPWASIHGYQSGHGDDDNTLRWITEGPAARDWPIEPVRPIINLEPPYENHIAYQSRQPIPAHDVRRAIYWSLLVTPTAGVSYGGHGVWGWEDGESPTAGHQNAGVGLAWRDAIGMPGAEQMAHVVDLFTSIDYWRLRPAPKALVEQPGDEQASRFIAVAATDDRALLVAYTPERGAIVLHTDAVPNGTAAWFDPRTGQRTEAEGRPSKTTVQFDAPGEGDWLLIVSAAR